MKPFVPVKEQLKSKEAVKAALIPQQNQSHSIIAPKHTQCLPGPDNLGMGRFGPNTQFSPMPRPLQYQEFRQPQIYSVFGPGFKIPALSQSSFLKVNSLVNDQQEQESHSESLNFQNQSEDLSN